MDTPVPVSTSLNYSGPIEQAQNQQSSDTQSGAMKTGADLLNSMTLARQNKLYQAQDLINQEIEKTIGAASTPIPVSGTGAVISPGQHSWQNIPNDNRPTYSRSGAKKQGIANAIRGAANIVGAFETKHVNDRNKALAIDIQRIMESNQGIESAKQTLQQDPNNKDAKDAIQKNGDIINAILSDPKKRKSIGKAFDINFIDPSQNNKPEHAALQQATKSYAEQLEAKMPNQMGPNQVAQNKLGVLAKQQENISKQIDAVNRDRTTEVYARLLEHEDTIAQKDRELEFKKQQQQQKVQHWQQQSIDRQNQLDERLQTLSDIAKLTNDTRLQVADKQVAGRLAAINKAIRGRIQYANSAGGQLRALNTNMLLAQRALQLIPTALLQAQDRYNFPGASPEDKKNMQEYINHLKDLKDMYSKMLTEDQTNFDNLIGNVNDDMSGGGDLNDTGSDDSNSDNNIPPVLNPNGARPSSDLRQLPSKIEESKPVTVQQTGPTEDKDQQTIDAIGKAIANS